MFVLYILYFKIPLMSFMLRARGGGANQSTFLSPQFAFYSSCAFFDFNISYNYCFFFLNQRSKRTGRRRNNGPKCEPKPQIWELLLL